jgi:hypothetical protein
MKRILEDIQLEKNGDIQKEKKARELAEKKDHALKIASLKLKSCILDKLLEHDNINEYIKNAMIEAAKEDKDEIPLITLPKPNPNLFPICSSSKKTSNHTKNKNCDYITFIGDIIDEVLNKNIFDIKLEYIGDLDVIGNMNISVKFKI